MLMNELVSLKLMESVDILYLDCWLISWILTTAKSWLYSFGDMHL